MSFRAATLQDIDRLARCEFHGRASRHRKYVEEDDDYLFIAEHGQEIVATLRYSRRLPSVLRDGHGLVSKIMQLTPAQVWGADAFCLPEYRNNGISRQLLLFALRWLADRGYTEAFGTIATTNLPSLRMSLNVGSRIVCYVSYVRFLSYKRLRISRALPRRVEARLEPALRSATRHTR